MRRASWNPELAGNVAGRWWRGVWGWGGEWWYGWGWGLFSRRMRRRMRWRRKIPLTLFLSDDTMFKVAAGSWTNQDQKRLVRFCHSIKYSNRDEWNFLEKCNLTRQQVCITHISLTVKLWKGRDLQYLCNFLFHAWSAIGASRIHLLKTFVFVQK